MLGTCFYSSDFNNLRLEKFVEDHPDDYEWVSNDDEEEYDYEEKIEEEAVYEYFKVEAIEDAPVKALMSDKLACRNITRNIIIAPNVYFSYVLCHTMSWIAIMLP
ncbi:unnamed protein product [Cylindrotheca closterium]|uniref:Uncharacterized protein n=1 Tax=Cylindrotheca closterium TaxID=2856 RepID=A0AAD2CHV8_9STRA|nr:unnamed protein product [Cylindrotheca closterium]